MQNDASYFSQKALSGGISIASSARSKNDSTSTIGSGRAPSAAISSGSQQRERSLSQSGPNPLLTQEEHRRISEQFPLASTAANILPVPTGSNLRKRSRMNDETMFIREGISKKESKAKKVQIDVIMQQLHGQIEQIFQKGEKGKTVINRLSILETFRNLGLEVFSLLATVINLQEERAAAQQQVASLQIQSNSASTATTSPYMDALLQAPNIVSGRIPPPPQIAPGLKHAPAERVLIFKSQRKGVQATREEQKEFRQDVKNVIGEELMSDIDVIRPTRNGGHTLIFNTTEAREEAITIFRINEKTAEPPIEEEQSCIVAPKKKYAKVVCRDPPDDISSASVLEEMYGKRNVQLSLIPSDLREARVVETKFGWIFEMSSIEAAAIQSQNGRIRYGIAQEMRVEEYIPIQQCYNCCNFGHSAKYCRMDMPCCRLCGVVGHAAWTCPHKDDKAKWKCANCMLQNEQKGMTLPTNHGAAQFHKCPCAQMQKNMRKAQLVAAGIYTVPETSSAQGMKGSIMRGMPQTTDGTQQYSQNRNRRKSRSRSLQKQVQKINNSTSSFSTFSTSSNASSMMPSSSSSVFPSASSSQQPGLNEISGYRNRMTKVPRPRSYDGWKQVQRKSENGGREENRGRDFTYQMQGTNSTSQLQMVDIDGRGPINSQLQGYDD